MGKGAYKVPPSVQIATEAAQSRVQNGLLGPIDNSVVDAMAQQALNQMQVAASVLDQFGNQQSQLYQNQLYQQQLQNMSALQQSWPINVAQQFNNSAPTWLEPTNPQYDAHIVAYRSRPKWGKVQERAATIVAFAALLPPILAVPIINRQTRIIAT